MKFSFPTVVTLITVLVSASAESTFVSGGSLNHEDGTNFNHRALRGDAEVMVQEEETFAPTSCLPDGYECAACVGECDDDCCSHTYHLGPMGLDQYCGLDPSCWGKDTLCVPGVSCTKCCNSWSMYLTGPYCD